MNETPDRPRLRQALTAIDRAALWLVGIGAVLVTALHTVSVVAGARQALGSGPLEVTEVPLGDASTPEVAQNLPAVTEAHYDSMTVVVEGAPALARWLLWGADATLSLAAIGVCAALVWLCLRVLRLRPFGRSLTVALWVTACLVLVGGLFPQLLGAMGRAEIVDHLGVATLAGQSGVPFSVELSLTPVGIALALGVVAAAFEIGERLQRDTEGLV